MRNPTVTADYAETQGQYLAFIYYYYTRIHGVPSVKADMQRYFKVSPPAVHNMVVPPGEARVQSANAWRESVDSAPVEP